MEAICLMPEPIARMLLNNVSVHKRAGAEKILLAIKEHGFNLFWRLFYRDKETRLNRKFFYLVWIKLEEFFDISYLLYDSKTDIYP